MTDTPASGGHLRMGLKLFRLREYVHASLWVVPGLCMAAAFLLALLLLPVDRMISQRRDAWFLFGGGPDSARALLATIATGMITFTGVVFSVTMLVLQLASQQFSPRILRSFLRDLTTQVVLGTFLATFTFALLTLRTVRSGSELTGEAPFVPSLAIWVALLLVLLSIGLFVEFINHIAQAIRAVTIIERVAAETRQVIDRMYPSAIGDEPEEPVRRPAQPPDRVIPSPGPAGVLLAVDAEQIVACSSREDAVLGLVPLIGDFVPEGAPLFRVWGSAAGLDEPALRRLVSIGRERTIEQDPLFGVRQLVDIAERALSPGINDPTTAVQVLDRLHDLLRRLVRRRFPSPHRLGTDGRLRAILPRPDWEDYVLAAVDEIRQYGTHHMQVTRRLRALLDDLCSVAPPQRRPALERELELLDAAVARGFADPGDRRIAQMPSPQGHGAVTDRPHTAVDRIVERTADGDGAAPS